MGFKVDSGFYIEQTDKRSMKEIGTMAVLKEKELNIWKMEKNMKENSNEINLMAQEFIGKMMAHKLVAFGKIMSLLF